MTELDRYTPTRAELDAIRDERRNAGVAAIDIELEVLDKAARIIPTMIDGGMAPDRYLPTHIPKKGERPQGRDVALAKAMAAAVYGATLGFGVAKSLQNVFTVHGQPAIYARTAAALVMSYGHTIETVESGPTSVTVRGRRKGSDHWEYSTWTIERAAAAGFTSNPKYKSQPEEMLYAKAVMTVCRRLFPDILEGVPYSSEELELEPVRMTATRTDSPPAADRGMDAVRAALAAKQDTADAPTSAPAEDPVPGYLDRLHAAADFDALSVVMGEAEAAGVTGDAYQTLADAANARLAALDGVDNTPAGGAE